MRTFFLVAAGAAALGAMLTWVFIEEPRGQIAEEMADGTIAMIDVA